jgi:hypothetical protein
MNYGQLKQTILNYAHRPDLADHAASFVSLAEGMIRRDLTAMPVSVTLDDTDRQTAGVYTVPVGLDTVRAIYATSPSGNSYPLEQVGLHQLRRVSVVSQPAMFAVQGTTLEIRGVPGEGSALEVHYMGHPPALSDDSDTNSLLDENEALYVYGSLFFLYQFTQDLELAQGALDTFANTIEKLNEHAGRKFGGASIAPAYHFGPISRGY